VTVVGCLGGGQLGRMLALAGIPLGLRFRFLDPAADACAGDVGELLVGPYDDPTLLDRLAEGTAAVTFEFENVPVESTRHVGALPGPRALEEGQDRLLEKELFRRLDIPTARFGSLDETGMPALVKRRRLGYDGKGQRRIDRADTLADDELAEELVPFSRELSIVAVRGRDGETRFYPLAENVHRGGVLRLSRVPALDAAEQIARDYTGRLLEELDYVGVLALELFEVEGGLLANEFAPRVHNTGHWTIDAAETSQFENHLRAILGLPLGPTDARAPCAMVNLIGEIPPLTELLALPAAHLHLYGKSPREGRKVGHVTLVEPEEAAVQAALALAAADL
jgi:5-(carboxyamino)imidazole ribonucleotide synthase